MQLKTGDIVEGKISGIKPFGVFVDLEGGLTGMVHISEISRSYVNDINDFIKVGDVRKMKVLSVGENGKIALSISKAGDEAPEYKKDRKPRPEKADFKPAGSFVFEPEQPTSQSFEDMMNKFKKRSDEKISDLKRKNPEARRTKRSSGGR